MHELSSRSPSVSNFSLNYELGEFFLLIMTLLAEVALGWNSRAGAKHEGQTPQLDRNFP